MYKKGAKTADFPHLLTEKSLKMPFLTLKYLTKYTPKSSFEEYINFQIFQYLRGVVDLFMFKVSEVIYAPSRPN